MRSIIALSLSFLLLSACTAGEGALVPDAEPDTTEQSSSEDLNMSSYSNESLGFGFDYSGEWLLDDSGLQGENPALLKLRSPEMQEALNIEDAYVPYDAEILLYIFDSVEYESSNVSNEYGVTTLEELLEANDFYVPIGETTLGGESAYEVYILGISQWYGVMAEHDGELYVFHFRKTYEKADLTDQDQAILDSFMFY